MLIMPWGMDMSFPSATHISSNALPAEQQEIAATLINPVLNYSISQGLGLANTVEANASHSGADVESGYRSTMRTAIGSAGLGLCIFRCRFGIQWYKKGKQMLGLRVRHGRDRALRCSRYFLFN
jgi:hypothetical protein